MPFTDARPRRQTCRSSNIGSIAKNDQLKDQSSLGAEIKGERQRIRSAALIAITGRHNEVPKWLITMATFIVSLPPMISRLAHSLLASRPAAQR
jgi:hypothetical protein